MYAGGLQWSPDPRAGGVVLWMGASDGYWFSRSVEKKEEQSQKRTKKKKKGKNDRKRKSKNVRHNSLVPARADLSANNHGYCTEQYRKSRIIICGLVVNAGRTL